MTEADTERRYLGADRAQVLHRVSGVFRRARPRRDHESVGFEERCIGSGEFVVSDHNRFGPQLAEILHEVVGERVVVVDYENPHPIVPPLSSMLLPIQS